MFYFILGWNALTTIHNHPLFIKIWFLRFQNTFFLIYHGNSGSTCANTINNQSIAMKSILYATFFSQITNHLLSLHVQEPILPLIIFLRTFYSHILFVRRLVKAPCKMGCICGSNSLGTIGNSWERMRPFPSPPLTPLSLNLPSTCTISVLPSAESEDRISNQLWKRLD